MNIINVRLLSRRFKRNKLLSSLDKHFTENITRNSFLTFIYVLPSQFLSNPTPHVNTNEAIFISINMILCLLNIALRFTPDLLCFCDWDDVNYCSYYMFYLLMCLCYHEVMN